MNKNEINYENEIILIELWNCVLKRKLLIVVVLFIAIIIGLLYQVLTKPVYESKATIKIGYLNKLVPPSEQDFHLLTKPVYESKSTILMGGYINKLAMPLEQDFQSLFLDTVIVVVENIEDSIEFRHRLIKEYNRKAHKYPYLNAVEINSDSITLSALANTPIDAKKYLEEIINQLLKDHYKKYNQLKSIYTKHLTELNSEVNNINSNIKMLEENKIDKLYDIIVLIEKIKMIDRRSLFERQINMIKKLLSEDYMRPTKVIENSTVSLSPSFLNFKKALLISIITGLLCGVFLAFCIENYLDLKKEFKFFNAEIWNIYRKND